MFVPFLYELRSRKVPVGTQEAVALAGALARGLHDSSLEGFYFVARALLVHDEKHLDAFDQAFAKTFEGVEASALYGGVRAGALAAVFGAAAALAVFKLPRIGQSPDFVAVAVHLLLFAAWLLLEALVA